MGTFYILIIWRESFRFEDENEYKNQIKLKVFEGVLKKDTTESFILLYFSPKK